MVPKQVCLHLTSIIYSDTFRRAKLKRLTTDDRERIMKSRALPEDFDMSHALQSPFGTGSSQSFASSSQTSTLTSPVYPSYEGALSRPLKVGGLRRNSEDESAISPISVSSNFRQIFTPPASVTASENLSPVSPPNDRAPLMAPSYSQASSRTPRMWGNRSSSFSNYHTPRVPRLQLHDRMGRGRAESLASPLRTSMSYTGNLDHATTTTEPILQASSTTQSSRTYWPESLASNQTSTGCESLVFITIE